MSAGKTAWQTKTRRSTRLLNALDGYERVLVVTHDNPDPDAIASGWGLCWLIREKLGKPTRLIGGRRDCAGREPSHGQAAGSTD